MLFILLLLLNVTRLLAAPSTPPDVVLSYMNRRNSDGSYQFQYATRNGVVVSEKRYINIQNDDSKAMGSEGNYKYKSPDEQHVSVSWHTDETGFHSGFDIIMDNSALSKIIHPKGNSAISRNSDENNHDPDYSVESESTSHKEPDGSSGTGTGAEKDTVPAQSGVGNLIDRFWNKVLGKATPDESETTEYPPDTEITSPAPVRPIG